MKNMGNKHSEEQKHTAMPVMGGFAFQFEFFIYKLITITNRQTVSLEKSDDTSIESDDCITFCQLKHSIKGVTISKDKNELLTNRATELWKTIDVWRKLITSNKTEEEQLKYISEHKFILVSNKKANKNELNLLSIQLKNNDCCNDEITNQLRRKFIINSTENNKHSKTQKMINEFINYKYHIDFLKKIEFEFECFSEIKNKCLEYIKEVMCFSDQEKQSVYDHFFREVYNDFISVAQIGKPLEYTHQQKIKRFQKVFQKHRKDKLDFKIKKEQYRENFLELNCIKQLIKVKDIKATDIDRIAKYTTNFLSFKNRYLSLIENHKILQEEDEEFKNDAINFWENKFYYYYDDIDDIDDKTYETVVKSKAKELLNKIREKNLAINQELLSNPFSNGAYYYLSDECEIGWHPKWKSFFKKNINNGQNIK